MKLVYGIVGVVAAVASIVVGILGMPDVMGVALVLAIALLLAANSDRIARMKAGLSGIEAETRAVIDEARATIEQLRAIAKLAVRANLSLVMRSGRLGGFKDGEREAVRIASIHALDELKVPPQEKEQMFEEWHAVVMFDYAFLLLGRHQVPKEVFGNALHAEWKTLRDREFANTASADAIAAFLSKAGMMNPERAELLEDYRFYEREKRHRRPEVWRQLVDSER